MKHKVWIILRLIALLSFAMIANAQNENQNANTNAAISDPQAEAKNSNAAALTPQGQRAAENSKDKDDKLTPAIIAAGVSLVIALLSYFHNRRMLNESKRHNQAVLNESKRADRRKVIEQALHEFYGPLLSYLNVINALYRLFASDKPTGFRTVTYLLNPDQEYDTGLGKKRVELSESDRKLLEEIITTEKKIEDLIITKGGLVDDPALVFDYIPDPRITDVKFDQRNLSLLAIAITHFRILRMAYKGSFQNEVERFKNFVYPRELDKKILDRCSELRAELKRLNE